MKINKSGINRICTKKEYNDKFKSLGYVVIEEFKEIEKDMSAEDMKIIQEISDGISIEDYSKGGGWYEYEGKSYRKDDLLEVIE